MPSIVVFVPPLWTPDCLYAVNAFTRLGQDAAIIRSGAGSYDYTRYEPGARPDSQEARQDSQEALMLR